MQCLNSFANFRDALLHNTSALSVPANAPYGTTSRTRARVVKESTLEADDDEDDEVDGDKADGETPDNKEEEGDEEEEEESDSGKGKSKSKGKAKSKGKGNGKGKGKGNSKGKGNGKGSDKKSKETKGKKGTEKDSEEIVDAKREKSEAPATEENKGKSTGAAETTSQTAARVHDYVATFKAVLYSIWHNNKGVDRAVLHGLRLASGYALDFKYFRNQHQDINEYLMHALEYLHTYDHRLLTSNSLISEEKPSETTEDKSKKDASAGDISFHSLSLPKFEIFDC